MPKQASHTTNLGDGITVIDTDYVRPLLDASHLVVDSGRAAFVDTGTNHSVPLLLDALERQGVDTAQVDYVFLTHVHLDHAGGAGELMSRLPNARAMLHPRGAPHMIDPTKLIRGSQAVYGDDLYRRMYGDIRAIPAERVIAVHDGERIELGERTLQCLFTEGHARHHYCLADPASGGVFTGDSFGVSYRELDTAAGEFIFPTTTPVHFDPVEAHKAIDRIMGLAPRRLYLTHYSEVTSLPRLADDMHRRIEAFVSIAKGHAADADRTAAMQQSMFAYLRTELERHGFEAGDERLHALLDVDVQLNVMGLEHWLGQGT
jgi:glyoxylase-like metal-dependent hydrolase (beta-lactamase superfamily II)